VMGIFFLVGRAIYYKSYITDPSTRTVGMVLGVFSYAVLTLGALIGIVIQLI
jgi:uncharacterized membrane protein YecN with MAPEG domain